MTQPGIDPGTVRLVAQCLTTGPELYMDRDECNPRTHTKLVQATS